MEINVSLENKISINDIFFHIMASFNGYTLVSQINKGTFAKIKLAICDKDGKEVAIKIIKKLESDAGKRVIIREITMLRCLNHPHIVKYIDLMEDDNKYYIVMEYVRGKQLFDKILYQDNVTSSEELSIILEDDSSAETDLTELANKLQSSGEVDNWFKKTNDSLSVLSMKTIKKYFSQIISAIGHCNANFIAHRDLKLENILVDDSDNIKIIDFGFADFMRSGHKTFCGSIYYIAPEIISGVDDYSSIKSDIWSLGIILFAMLTGRLPFGGKNDKEISRRILEQKLTLPEYLADDVSDLIRRMLRKDPEKRITLSGIRNHVWMKNYVLPLYLPESITNLERIRFIDNNVIDKMVKMGYDDIDVVTSIRREHNNECVVVYRVLCDKYNVNTAAKDMVDKLESPELPRKLSRGTSQPSLTKKSPGVSRFFRSRRTSH